jgi:hypothetical protein
LDCVKFCLHKLLSWKITDRERTDEPFVVHENRLTTPAGKFPMITDTKGNVIPSQVDDLNHDRQWDEMAFVYSLKPKESIKLSIEFVDKLPEFKSRTYARLGKRNAVTGKFETVTIETHPKDHIAQSEPWRYQCPGWENDKVAFRGYFDSRNGKDIYGKITPRMVLDSISCLAITINLMLVGEWMC